MSELYDALVIGGGPGGAAAALLLARAGWSVALLERKTFPRRKVCGEYLSATNLPLLENLGVASAFRETAGPAVKRVGLFAGSSALTADLPQPQGPRAEWGRALGREHLDTLLLEHAARAGADIRQPWSAMRLDRDGENFVCSARAHAEDTDAVLHGRLIVAAHGSWEPGSLPTQPRRRPPRGEDLFGFKAHFRNSNLPADLMPLLAFPGGYGGMVHCDGGRVSLSCCVRRDTLTRLRRDTHADAGEAVLAHIAGACRGVRQELDGAERDGAWMSVGPIRPGIRLNPAAGIFPVGNAAGEAHPIVAEGISMAMQSAWLLATRLIAWRNAGGSSSHLREVGIQYASAWRQCFASRLYASQLFAQWAMRPAAVASVLPFLRFVPPILTWGARWTGKARQLSIRRTKS